MSGAITSRTRITAIVPAAGRTEGGTEMPEGGTVRVGVIGVGVFGSLHARVYAEAETAELVAVADVDAGRAAGLAGQYGCASYSDYRELLARSDVDAVSVCTTDRLHAEPVIAALQAGKHVMVEKPLATTLEDCDAMIVAARAAGVTLTVGHILRFDPRYRAAHDAIRAGRIGRPLHIAARRNNRRSAATRLADKTTVHFFLGIHDLDCLLWCLGRPLRHVYAESVPADAASPEAYLCLLRFADGTLASLEVSWALPESYPGRLDAAWEVVGTEGSLYVEGGGVGTLLHDEAGTEALDNRYYGEVDGRFVGPLRDELHHFLRCLRDGAPPLVTPEEARSAVEVVLALERSRREGRAVTL
jgi:UDP-N-acetylglucosamine 3-dehydrogenase